MNQTTRPDSITTALNTITTNNAEFGAVLEGYIAGLEANQQTTKVSTTAHDTTNAPAWSHMRAMEGQQRRQVRALKKQTNDWR